MGYKYEDEKPELFTENGSRMFLKYRDTAFYLLAKSGAIRMQELMTAAATGGSSWTMMACVDRMIELGELREIPQDEPAGQHRIFVKA